MEGARAVLEEKAKMFKRSVIAASVLTVWVAVAGAQAAHADWFTLGGSFRIGPIRFSLVLGDPFQRGHQDYFYRTLQPIEYSGYRCTDRCFRRDSYSYHHQSCPLVHRHLSVYRVDPDEVIGRYGVYDDPDSSYYGDGGRGRYGRGDYRYGEGEYRSRERYDDDSYYYGGYPEEGGHRRNRSSRNRHRGHPGHDQCPRVH